MIQPHALVHDLLRQLAAGEGVRPHSVRVDADVLRHTVQILENLTNICVSHRGLTADVREADACRHTLRGILGDAGEQLEVDAVEVDHA